LAVFALPLIPALAQSPSLSSCAEDTRINAANKKAIDSAAMDFVRTVLGPNPSAAFDSFSKEGQANVTRAQFSGEAATFMQQFEPKNVTVQHTYLIELKGDSPGRAVCGENLAKPEGWELLVVRSVPQQAYVVLSADTRNNKLAFTVWLVPEQNHWKVQSFSRNISSLAGMGSMQLWELARTQQSRGHYFNAALLYAGAAQTADRGPNFQMGIAKSISEDMSKLAAPLELQGQPPFLWKSGETTYKVLTVGPIAVGGKIYVILVHEVSPWQSNDQVDGWNKLLLGFVKQRFPEYSDMFAGLVARAVERGSNRGYGTVEELPARKQ